MEYKPTHIVFYHNEIDDTGCVINKEIECFELNKDNIVTITNFVNSEIATHALCGNKNYSYKIMFSDNSHTEQRVLVMLCDLSVKNPRSYIVTNNYCIELKYFIEQLTNGICIPKPQIIPTKQFDLTAFDILDMMT